MKVFRHLLSIALAVSMVTGDAFNPLDLVASFKFKNKKNKEITGFSQEEKDNLVNLHNAYRSLVRPYGADMIEVTWDDEIAAFAQNWANQCTATHRRNRDLTPWTNMGENLYWWYGGSYNEGRAVKYWWDEVQYYTMSTKACVRGEVCGHYVTMVWGKTEKIGCGVARCDRLLAHEDYGRGAYYFVCNYSGRFISNTKPYVATDIPCSYCYNTDYPKCRHNLCVTEEMLTSGKGYDGNTAMVGLYRSKNVTSENANPGPTKVTSSPDHTTAPPPSTMNPGSTTVAWGMLDDIDEYCRNRGNDYVRQVCWRLNNILRDQLGLPRIEQKDRRDSDFAQEGGKLTLSVRDAGLTTESANQLASAFEEVDHYCNDRSNTYSRRICLRVDQKMKEILGVSGSGASSESDSSGE